MSSIDPLQLLKLQEKFDLLQAAVETMPREDDRAESLRMLLSHVEHLLSHARQLLELADPWVEPMPWWQEWQRKQTQGSD